MNESAPLTCLNCGAPISEDASYCSNCGQEKRSKRATVGELLSDAFSSITNWDNSFWQTIKAICIPGKITQEYFRGKRKNYIPPVRLFLVSAVFFFAALNSNFGDIFTISVSDSKDLKTLLEEVVYHNLYQLKLDSITKEIKTVYPAEEAQLAIDSTTSAFNALVYSDSMSLNDVVATDLNLENADGDKINFTVADLRKDPDVFIAENKIEGFWGQTIVRQGMRFAKNPDSLVQFMVGQFTWMCLIMMPFIALTLKILYWRRKRYFVEHLVFTFHLQSFSFLLLTLGLLLMPENTDAIINWSIGLAIIGFIYSFIAFYRFYTQGVIKTFFKQQVTILSYLLLLSFSLVLTLIVSALVF